MTTYDSFVCLRLQKEYDLHKWSVAASVLNLLSGTADKKHRGWTGAKNLSPG